MKIFFIICLLGCTMAAGAQTQLIAFKSHSGTTIEFENAAANGSATVYESDFGLPPEVSLDSVILIKKSVAVVISSRSTGGERWRVSKDTIKSRTLFNKKIALDSLKKNIRKYIKYTNSPDSIRFIGFGTDKEPSRSALLPIGYSGSKPYNPFDGAALFIVAGIFLLSLLAALVAWKWKPAIFRQPQPAVS